MTADDETETLIAWKANVADHFRRIVTDPDLLATGCGSYRMRKGFGGVIELTPAAARTLLELLRR